MKKRLTLTLTGVALLSGLIVGGVKATQADTGQNDPGIIQTVQHQGEELDNHEARISNTENNVKDLQNKTGTPSSSSNTSVPAVTTQKPASTATPAPTPAPTQVTITGYWLEGEGTNNEIVHLNYSDGSTHAYHYTEQPPGELAVATNGNPPGNWLVGKAKANNYFGY